jgi:hypothetical protein
MDIHTHTYMYTLWYGRGADNHSPPYAREIQAWRAKTKTNSPAWRVFFSSLNWFFLPWSRVVFSLVKILYYSLVLRVSGKTCPHPWIWGYVLTLTDLYVRGRDLAWWSEQSLCTTATRVQILGKDSLEKFGCIPPAPWAFMGWICAQHFYTNSTNFISFYTHSLLACHNDGALLFHKSGRLPVLVLPPLSHQHRDRLQALSVHAARQTLHIPRIAHIWW